MITLETPAAETQAAIALQQASQKGMNTMRSLLKDPHIHDSSIEGTVLDDMAGMSVEEMKAYQRGQQAAASSRNNRVVIPEIAEKK